MALAELQAALARLSTDPAARALLIGDPEAFARQASLTPEELATVCEQAENSLHVFALSLLHKRSREAGRAMPLTQAALGEAYAKIFEGYAASNPVARDPAHDARNFLRWLPAHGRVVLPVRQCARFESAWLRMRLTDRRFQIGIFALPTAPFRILAVWWRPQRAKPCRYWQWPKASA